MHLPGRAGNPRQLPQQRIDVTLGKAVQVQNLGPAGSVPEWLRAAGETRIRIAEGSEHTDRVGVQMRRRVLQKQE